MIGKIIKGVFSQTFLVVWAVIVIANQLFIFHGCFAPYCLIAALPHTSVIAALITYFINESECKATDQFSTHNTFAQPKKPDSDFDSFEDATEPFCPKCGSKMVLRTAKKGSHSGQKFWGCSKFPNCNGILNI